MSGNAAAAAAAIDVSGPAPLPPQSAGSTNPFAQYAVGQGEGGVPSPAAPPAPAPPAAQPTPSSSGANPFAGYAVGQGDAPSSTATVPQPANDDTPPPAHVLDDHQQPQPDTLGYLQHLGGVAARGAAEGTAGIVLDPLALAAKGIDYATGSKALSTLATAPQQFDQTLTGVGLPQPQGGGERILEAASSAVPNALISGGLGEAALASGKLAAISPKLAQLAGLLRASPATMAVSGAASGAGQQAATEAGAGPVVSTLVGLGAGALAPAAVHGIGSTLLDTAARLNLPGSGGQEGLAGRYLVSNMQNPQQSVGRIMQPAQAEIAPRTTGEVTGDLGLLSLERGMRSDKENAGSQFAAMDAQRAAQRVSVLQGLTGSGNSESRGQLIRSVLSDDVTPAIKGRVGQLYKAAEANNPTLDLTPIHQSIADTLGERGIYGPGAGNPPSAIRQPMMDLARRKSASSVYLENVRKRLGNAAGMASRSGDNQAASVAGRLRTEIDSLRGSPEYGVAQQARREQGLALGRDEHGANATGHVLKPDRFGTPALEDGRVAGRVIRDAASTRQVLRAAATALKMAKEAGQDTTTLAVRLEHMRAAMRGEFMHRLIDHASTETGALDEHGNPIPNLTAHKFLTYWNAHHDVAKQLFGAEHFGRLAQVAHDFDAEAAAIKGRGAGIVNSHTGANVSGARYLAHVGMGRTPGASGLSLRARQLLGMLAAVGAGGAAAHAGGMLHLGGEAAEIVPLMLFGHGGAKAVAHAVSGVGSKGIRQLLVEAAADPNVARRLVQKVSPRTLNRIADGVHRSRLQRIAVSVTRAAPTNLLEQQERTP